MMRAQVSRFALPPVANHGLYRCLLRILGRLGRLEAVGLVHVQITVGKYVPSSWAEKRAPLDLPSGRL